MEQPQQQQLRNTENFYEMNKDRFTSTIFLYKNTKVRYLLPKAYEESKKKYQGDIETALKANKDFFGSIPTSFTISFLDNTEDFQYFAPKKQKGDYINGYARGTRITMFLPSAYETETTFHPADYEDPEAAKTARFQNTLAHEIAHCTTDHIVWKKNKGLPPWANEAIAQQLETHQIVRKASEEKNKKIRDYIVSHYSTFPTDEQLRTDQIYSPLKYSFGKLFYAFLRNKTGLTNNVFTQDVLNQFRDYGEDFLSFLSHYFKKPSEEMYQEFLQGL